MTLKVFLKFNRSEIFSIVCLTYWLELFKEYDITIVCDLFDTKIDAVPDYLKRLVYLKNVSIINSDYSLGEEYSKNFKKKNRKIASANLTCFNSLGNYKGHFWIIDADDTMFLSRDYENIKSKIKQAEKIAVDESLDGFSLDFYREYNDTWTFGVCLLHSNLQWKQIKNISNEELLLSNLVLNPDCLFDLLGRRNILKLKSFAFDGCTFQHVINNVPYINEGIYFWKNGYIWNKPIHKDVVII
jgi:hypothetical protein